jgi:acetyl-CoA carboxylase biotin carboxylase subunit
MERILVANRGEIACRIIRTIQQLGKTAIAVYSEADVDAPHRRLADMAVAIGPSAPQQSYLHMDALLEAAQTSGAEGIHPGYGFLAENTSFARSCESAGMVFIGPSPDAMAAVGDKATARHIARQAGVPVIPGSGTESLTVEQARQIAERIGYPVLLKAAGGGGGIGMQVVIHPDALERAFNMAQNRAQSAFANPALYIEKFIRNPRHIEVQVLGDRYGNLVHLYERECSIQRRHQKVLEEAPAPLLEQPGHAELRTRMLQAALNLAAAVRYASAGTVEFLVDDEQGFYFIEMNARLQVEHTVTEAITGIDLVAEQIRIAEGEPLAWRQADIKCSGAALECRIYAENPDKNFLPSPGRIQNLQLPLGDGIRVDSGITAGYQVTPYYDPMLVKVITHGNTRADAIALMRQALAATVVEGVANNIRLHQRILENPHFHQGNLDTDFLFSKLEAQ